VSVAVRLCDAVAPSLARVSWKVKPSVVPVDFIAVPEGRVAVHVAPFVLDRLMDLVPVPLW
jgi:hypothetical protein